MFLPGYDVYNTAGTRNWPNRKGRIIKWNVKYTSNTLQWNKIAFSLAGEEILQKWKSSKDQIFTGFQKY